MSRHHQFILGIYRSRRQLRKVVESLKEVGILPEEICIHQPNSEGSHRYAHADGNKGKFGALTGAVVGLAIGSTVGLLIGLGELTVPWISLHFVVGPISSTLFGAAIGAVLGGGSGTLIGLAFAEYKADPFDRLVTSGGYLMCVETPNFELAEAAKMHMKKMGAAEISETDQLSASWPPLTHVFKNQESSYLYLHRTNS